MRNLFKIAGLLALTGFISSCNDKETTANYQVIPLPQEITTAQSQPFTFCLSWVWNQKTPKLIS